MTQETQLLKHFQSGRSITKLEALNLYGIWNSGDTVFKLRNKGHNIKTTMIKDGNKHYAKYYLTD